MDMQTPDHTTNIFPPDREPPLSRVFARRLRQALATAVPDGSRQTAQELFDSFDPDDPVDAQLAALAVAAAQSAMDGFARAARPGISDETAIRLRGSALAAGRAFAVWARTLRNRESAAEQPRAAAAPAPQPQPQPPAAEPAREVPEVPPGFIALQPGAKPIPAIETFQPRDRFGKPIPTGRTDLMTRAQVLASLTLPRDAKLEAAALAEEEAMIAEQAARKVTANGRSG